MTTRIGLCTRAIALTLLLGSLALAEPAATTKASAAEGSASGAPANVAKSKAKAATKGKTATTPAGTPTTKTAAKAPAPAVKAGLGAAKDAPPAESSAPSQPPPGASPISDLRSANERLKKAVAKAGPSWTPEAEAKNAEVKKIVGELLDFEELGRRALARHWAGLAVHQRTEFLGTLRALVERSYLRSVHGQPDYQLEFDKETREGNEATVPATIKASRKGKKISMALLYHLIWKNGRYVVYDVVTDDLSLLENYRTEFSRVIAKEGFDGLLGRMKKKLDEKSGG
jgi:phospholipid transport system substrate-binding protein